MKRLLDAQDHPETFTEEELEAILKEDDLRETAELMARLKQAYIGKETEDIDVDAEWQRFALRKPKRRSWGWMQIAAAFIGLLMLSGITYAAIHIVSSNRSQQAEVQDTTAVAHKGPAPAVKFASHEGLTSCEPKTFENVPLKDIATELVSFYHINIETRNAETAALRLYYPWNPQMPLRQVVEELNRFEKVHLTLTNDRLIIE